MASSRLNLRKSADHGRPTIHTTGMELSDYPRKSADVMTERQVDDKYDAEPIEDADGNGSRPKDVIDMQRMGKNQQLVRRFREITIACFVSVTVSAWTYCLFLISPGLIDGGTAGLLYGMLWSMVGFTAIYMSIAEMSSMAPIAGSLYHWVSEFAPESIQGPLSYVTGWTSTLAYQATNAEGLLLAGSLIQTVILVADPNYAFPAWQGTLFAWGSIILSYVINAYGVRALPYWQVPAFAVSMMVYCAFIVPIWVSAPSISSEAVWTTFSNTGDWPNMGLTILVGQLSGISMWTGVDAAAHMSEETKDASIAVPRAMMTIYFLNALLVCPLIITLCYHLTDVTAALNDPTTYPSIWVLKQAMSTRWVLVILILMVVLVEASNVTFLAAVSRDLFAFARDKGVPFSKWISTVEPKRSIPRNANIFSCIFAGALSIIYIGSPVAFYAITALGTVSLLQCYIFAIGSLLWRRIAKPETLPPARFSLGRWGIFTNCVALAFAFWAFFWCFWPQAQPVTASGFNWASPIYVLAFTASGAYYYLRAKRTYEGPVATVEGRHVGHH